MSDPIPGSKEGVEAPGKPRQAARLRSGLMDIPRLSLRDNSLGEGQQDRWLADATRWVFQLCRLLASWRRGKDWDFSEADIRVISISA